MAKGVRKALNAKFGLAITGIAGPAGGTPDKPVGTVFISLAENKREKTRKFLLIGDRERIRWVATQTALDMVRRRLLK
jgi:nicotinamide-nucleotide amidase